MFATLQAAPGSWLADASHQDSRALASSGLNERLDFGEDERATSTSAAVFVVRGKDYPIGKVFVPPYFVPPDRPNATRQVEADSDRSQYAPHANAVSKTTAAIDNDGPVTHSLMRIAPEPLMIHANSSAVDLISTETPEPLNIHGTTGSLTSPGEALDIERERESNWSESARRAFHTMIKAPGYVNRYRLSQDKHDRLLAYLCNPEVDPICDDGSKDHQTKYQAAHWVIKNDGKLYRKAEVKDAGAKGGFRRHLDLDETWNVLTAEHIRSGHLGRDRLRKKLEKCFIG